MNAQILWFDTVTSTNDILAEKARRGAKHGTVIAAHGQTAGKGTKGRTFYSPEGFGVYFSVLLRPAIFDIDYVSAATRRCAVIASEVIEEICGIKAEIKPVNDLILRGRKICGILCEAFPETDGTHFVICGFGFNLTEPPDGYPDLPLAGSVFESDSQMPDNFAETLVTAISARLSEESFETTC